MTGALPPYAVTLGVVETAVADVLRLPAGPDVLGRPGFLHGGAIVGLLEMAAYRAAGLAAPAGVRLKPITVTVDFLRGGRMVDTFARGRVTRLGARIANVEAVAWQEDEGRPIGAARLNFLIADRPAPG